MFHRMPLILLGLIVLVMGFGSYLPLELKQLLFAASISIKSVILFLLPVVIFGLLFKAAVNLAKQAGGMILLIVASVCSSNFIAAYLSHYIGSFVYHLNLSVSLPKPTHALQPAWNYELPKLIGNEKAMVAAIVVGVIFSIVNQQKAKQFASKLNWVVDKLLVSFVCMIPFFVAGYLVKLQADGMMTTIIKNYSLIFIIVGVAQFAYIALFYLVANQLNIGRWLQSIKNMLPAAISGFGTMSSAACMPLTIIGVERNAKNKALASSIVPATVNIHLLGDCVAIPIFAYAVMKSFGLAEPSMMNYLIFNVYFVIAKFSVAAVPGGGILVMLPILASCLGFDTAMLSLITALYVLFDPITTAANVFGNGALAKMIDVFSTSIFKSKELAMEESEA